MHFSLLKNIFQTNPPSQILKNFHIIPLNTLNTLLLHPYIHPKISFIRKNSVERFFPDNDSPIM